MRETVPVFELAVGDHIAHPDGQISQITAIASAGEHAFRVHYTTPATGAAGTFTALGIDDAVTLID